MVVFPEGLEYEDGVGVVAEELGEQEGEELVDHEAALHRGLAETQG